MSKRRKKSKFNIPKPDVDGAIKASSKYYVGAPLTSFRDITSKRPIFAFDYLSLKQSDLCFDSKSRTKEDLIGFISGLKKISTFTYDEMSRQKAMRFHKLDLEDSEVKLNTDDFFSILAPSGRGMTIEELPDLYQIDIQYKIEARIVGFLFREVFYIIWYDRHHLIYPKK